MYNLTPNQKELARWILRQIEERKLDETFFIRFQAEKDKHLMASGRTEALTGRHGPLDFDAITSGSFDALVAAGLLQRKTTLEEKRFQLEDVAFTITGQLRKAIEEDFAEKPPPIAVATSAECPPEIRMSIERFREAYPDSKKIGFLIMRFAAEKPYAAIVAAIEKTAGEHGLTILRADAHEFHSDLLSNIRTYLHGCGFGIAIYERIQTDEPNANVGLEVGYLLAMNKPVLLLKDKTLKTIQSDLAGRLFKPFDPHDPEGTIPEQIRKWLEDYGIIVKSRKA